VYITYRFLILNSGRITTESYTLIQIQTFYNIKESRIIYCTAIAAAHIILCQEMGPIGNNNIYNLNWERGPYFGLLLSNV